MYEILVEIYWAVFFVLRDWSWTIAGILAALAILRPIKKYAFAQPIIIKGDFIYSTFILRTCWRLAVKLGIVKDDDDDIRQPYGAHLYGSGIDVGITAILIPLLGFLWPLFLIILVGYFPLELMHTHHARKKEFMGRLKGEITT